MEVQDCLLLVLRKQRQEDHEFRTSLGFILRLYFQRNSQKTSIPLLLITTHLPDHSKHSQYHCLLQTPPIIETYWNNSGFFHISPPPSPAQGTIFPFPVAFWLISEKSNFPSVSHGRTASVNDVNPPVARDDSQQAVWSTCLGLQSLTRSESYLTTCSVRLFSAFSSPDYSFLYLNFHSLPLS